MKNILLGITSSIAAYKAYELIRLYRKNGFEVKVVLSENALNFVSPLTIEVLSSNKAYYSQFEERDDVEHISLAQWADIFVVAPISANTISKFRAGICDNLLSSVFCAYLGYKKPILLAPAMNTGMWENPFVKENLEKLKAAGCDITEPEEGFLACNSEGKGRLADISLIYQNTLRNLFQDKKNNSKKVLVTIGGTKEKIDTVRYITNSSSGKMGIALANCAYQMGFNVSAITTVEYLSPYTKTTVQSADEMLEAIKKEDFDYLIMAAAVGDFKVLNISEHKISKEDIKENFSLELTKNPDIVKTIAKNKREGQKIIGFCLTDEDLIDCAKKKLNDKNLDYIVANDVKTALNTDSNKVTIIEKSGKIIDIEKDTKENIARRILEVVCD